MRVRDVGEITPLHANSSAVFDELYSAQNAIDLNLATHSWTIPDPDQALWFTVTLQHVHCVTDVYFLDSAGNTQDLSLIHI